VGVVVTTADTVYHIDEGLKQFEPVLALPNDNIIQVQTYNNNLYALDTKNGQIIKITDIKGKFTTTVIARGDYSQIRDFAIDKDIYLLSADSVTKITNGNALAFPLPPMTDKISNGTRIFVAGNIYILEANKKRVVILNKTGALLNQISFPTATTPEELSVDEAQRSLYLLDNNQLLRITY
jgi:sugar lactone lactonase YvrE